MEKKKQTVPQISPKTGVSGDYFNEFWGKASKLEISQEEFKKSIHDRPIKKYAQRFPSDEYEGVISPKNKDAVQELDDIVDSVNSLAKSENFSERRFKELVNRATRLIYGEERELPYKD